MTVPSDSRRRISASKAVNDLEAGDLVRRKGHRGVGLVEDVNNDGFAWIAWSQTHRDYLPLVALRKVRAGGHDLDRRKRP